MQKYKNPFTECTNSINFIERIKIVKGRKLFKSSDSKSLGFLPIGTCKFKDSEGKNIGSKKKLIFAF